MGARTREDIDKDNAQRMQRVSLWVARADAPRTMTPHIANVDDAAIRFIFYWIAFESAFAVKVSTDNARMEKFINDAVGHGRFGVWRDVAHEQPSCDDGDGVAGDARGFLAAQQYENACGMAAAV